MRLSYSIRAMVEETGLSAHTIRAWERRYNALSPHRTDSNRRVYGEEDVRRLKLLRRAVESGHSIGMIASLPTEELGRLTRLGESNQEGLSPVPEGAPQFVNAAIQALAQLDALEFESVLIRATVVLGVDGFVEGVVAPLMAVVGQRWKQGRLSIAQEHLASALVRTHLDRTRLSIKASADAPKMVVATPAGQHHEIGAMMAAIVGARTDWNVTYLGPNLPAEDIADAVGSTRASAVALSLVYPPGDPKTDEELRRLGRLLRPGIALLVGGESAQSYAAALEEIGATLCRDLESLRTLLARIRMPEASRRAKEDG